MKNIFKYLLLFVLVQTAPEILYAQSTVSGTVNLGNRHDKSGVMVYQADTENFVITDSDGKFVFNSKNPGLPRLIAQKKGFLPVGLDSVFGIAGSESFNLDLIPGDVNSDNKIDLLDLVSVLNKKNTASGASEFDDSYDFNDDDFIDSLDINTVLTNFRNSSITQFQNFQAGIINHNGGIVEIDNSVKLDFPVNSVSKETQVSITKKSLQGNHVLYADVKPACPVYSLNPHGIILDDSVDVSINLKEIHIPDGFTINDFEMMHFNGYTWESLNSSIDEDCLKAKILSFSYLTVRLKLTETTRFLSNSVKIYLNKNNILCFGSVTASFDIHTMKAVMESFDNLSNEQIVYEVRLYEKSFPSDKLIRAKQSCKVVWMPEVKGSFYNFDWGPHQVIDGKIVDQDIGPGRFPYRCYTPGAASAVSGGNTYKCLENIIEYNAGQEKSSIFSYDYEFLKTAGSDADTWADFLGDVFYSDRMNEFIDLSNLKNDGETKYYVTIEQNYHDGFTSLSAAGSIIIKSREFLLSDISVNEADSGPDIVTISNPEDGEEYIYGDTIQFEGIAVDPGQGELSGDQLKWESNINKGIIGYGKNVQTDRLLTGNHTITLTAANNSGFVKRNSIIVKVNKPIGGNINPHKPGDPFPSSGAINVPTDVVLTWKGGDPDSGNRVIYSGALLEYDSLQTVPEIDIPETQNELFHAANLKENTQYYWFIISSDDYGGWNKSRSWVFTTKSNSGNNPPNLPFNEFPENGEVINSNNILISWECTDPEGDKILYDIYIDDKLIKSYHPENSYAVDSLEYEKNYSWKITARDEKGAETGVNSLQGDNRWYFYTKKPAGLPPDKPVLVYPPDNLSDIPSELLLRWHGNDSENDELEHIVYFTENIADTNDNSSIASASSLENAGLSNLEYNRTYYWRVLSKEKGNPLNTAFSKVHSFKVAGGPVLNSPPPIPELPVEPTEGISGNEYSFNTSSADVENDEISYEINWGDGTSNKLSEFLPSGEVLTVTRRFNVPGVYQIKIRARDSKGLYSDWTDFFDFTVLPDTDKLNEIIINDGYGDYVSVPAGEFQMGSNSTDAENREKPVHPVYVDEFFISKYEITNREYKKFIDEGGYNKQEYWTNGGFQQGWQEPEYWNDADLKGGGVPGNEDFPVRGVSWYEAMAYCSWLSEKTGNMYRLPTEAEWEKAAKGTDMRRFPWGNICTGNYANMFSSESPYYKNVTPAGFYNGTLNENFPTFRNASPYGAFDMAGNLAEWCYDYYDKKYYQI